jgi:predicted amidohydrolase YtcJ
MSYHPFITLFVLCCAINTAAADTLYTNAKIYTVDNTNPWANEVSVADGKITCVGDTGACAATATHIVDMRGRFMMPGIIDAHNHVRYAMGSTFLSVAEAGEYQDFLNIIEAHAKQFPELKWIQGDGWNYSIFEGGMPNYKNIDGLAQGRPIILTSYDAHTQLLNRAAMDAFGITRNTKRTPLGTIMRDANGEPTGIFKAAIYVSEKDQEALYDVLPAPDPEDLYHSFIGNLNKASANGITSIVEPQMYPEDIDFFERARNEGKLNAHIHLALYHPPGVGTDTLKEYKSIRDHYATDAQIHVPALKLYIDDVIESESAALFEPYVGTDNIGELFYEAGEFNALISQLDAEKFQIFIHAIGDRGINTALNALEISRKANGAPAAPHQLVHVELLQPSDIERFKLLDVSATMQPRHMSPDVSLQWAKNIGPARLKNAWPLKSLSDAGARFAFSSDWNVAEMNPMYGIFTAVTRTGLSGKPKGGWQPQQKIDVATALYGYTLGSAIANGMADQRGSIAKGKYADIVVLGMNPFEVPPEILKDIPIIETIFEGKTIFKAIADET